jgi:hypothetical protein
VFRLLPGRAAPAHAHAVAPTEIDAGETPCGQLAPATP